MTRIAWREWGDEAFDLAKQSDRPVLLFLFASWCRFCREMEQNVFEDAKIAVVVGERYVPVRVDKDKRPEINQRYNLGGWPTLAFLTPGGDLISGGSSLSVDEASALIEKVPDYFKNHREQIDVDIEKIVASQEKIDRERLSRKGEFSAAIVDKVATAILEAFDRKHGGFGEGQKFPHPEAIDFSIIYFAKTRDPAFQEIVMKTLTAMQEGRLHDDVAGGFFRYCAIRDWQQPHTEKLLESQAGLLRNYLEAYQMSERADFRKVARKILSYLETHLFDPQTGAWFGSQDADDAYYSLTERERLDRKEPRVEPTCYTPSVAMTASALLKAASVFRDDALKQRALGALNFLLERCYSAGRGMYHYFDGKRHILGLLVDQIYTARALLHAIQYTGDNVYLPVVEDLITTIIKKQSATHGGFYDIAEDDAKFGSLRRRQTSLLENGVMAEVLIRTYFMTRERNYMELAERTLKAFAADYQLYGYFTASYARAVELFFHPPVCVVLVGSRAQPAFQRLLTVAQEIFIPSKLILSIDPAEESDLLERHQFPKAAQPTCYLCLQHSCVAEVSDPERLPEEMHKAERGRAAK